MSQHPTRYGFASCVLFILAVVLFLVTSVIFEGALSALPSAVERLIGFLTLVLPTAVGVVLGLNGLLRARDNRIAALVGVLLNAGFGAFFALVLLFGG